MRTNKLQAACVMALVLGGGLLTPAKSAAENAAARKPGNRLQSPGCSADKGAGRPHYDALFKIHAPTFAEEIVARIRKGMDKELSGKKFGEGGEEFAIRKAIVQNIGNSIIPAVRQADDVSLGWKLDRKTGRTYLDLTVEALPGTPLAERFAQTARLKTNFAGFKTPAAALSANWVGQASVEEAAAAAKVVQMVRDRAMRLAKQPGLTSDALKTRRDLVGRLFDVAAVTAAGGRSDGAVSLVVRPDRVTLIAGAYVADGRKLQSVVKPVLQYLSGRHEALANLKLNAATCQGVSLHTLSIPAPTNTDRDKFIRMFGKSMEIVLGFGPQAAYLAVGKDAMESLKRAIGKSSKPAAPAHPFEISLAMKPIADFIAATGKLHERIPAGFASAALSKAPGKDHVRLLVKPSARGMTLRLEAERGVLEVIGAISPKAKRFLLRQ